MAGLDSDGLSYLQKDEIQCKSIASVFFTAPPIFDQLETLILNHSLISAGRACRNLRHLPAIGTVLRAGDRVRVQGVFRTTPTTIIPLHV